RRPGRARKPNPGRRRGPEPRFWVSLFTVSRIPSASPERLARLIVGEEDVSGCTQPSPRPTRIATSARRAVSETSGTRRYADHRLPVMAPLLEELGPALPLDVAVGGGGSGGWWSWSWSTSRQQAPGASQVGHRVRCSFMRNVPI